MASSLRRSMARNACHTQDLLNICKQVGKTRKKNLPLSMVKYFEHKVRQYERDYGILIEASGMTVAEYIINDYRSSGMGIGFTDFLTEEERKWYLDGDERIEQVEADITDRLEREHDRKAGRKMNDGYINSIAYRLDIGTLMGRCAIDYVQADTALGLWCRARWRPVARSW